MRWLILLLFWSQLLAAQSQAVIFIDSSQPLQARLVADVNKMLFFSPTLRADLSVQVFDINKQSFPFSGTLRYVRDSAGKAISQYRPQGLPYLICLNEKTEQLRIALKNKEQLCLCVKKC
ncbi:hypothetical protein [Intestinirhabdus alba]|jgi:hypothetical protein|uniref:Uncharacterized protein n=1 Tax=Intestinirhabdus alba TaxID=2899544 RepID=A0A6L6IFH3_9ENTR|nr:hypothetical protein [Intestinirhabdus alba]MTH45582.1 hypothetical protein [Intestinirhabdus alba]